MLYVTKRFIISVGRSEFDDTVCDNLKDQDLDTALKAIESDTEVRINAECFHRIIFYSTFVNE